MCVLYGNLEGAGNTVIAKCYVNPAKKFLVVCVCCGTWYGVGNWCVVHDTFM